jgi:hypothetical protein
MYILYDKLDCGLGQAGKNVPAFQDLQVYALLSVRTDIFDKTEMQNWVKKTDGNKGKPSGNRKNWVYNHHVPHSRILKAIEANILGKSRLDAMDWLVEVVKKLEIQPDEYFNKLFKSHTPNRMAYDARVDWCIGSICDWKQNIFYGPGSGDHRGTTLDTPPKKTKQYTRVKDAAKKLREVIGVKLSIDEEVKHTDEKVWAEKDPSKPTFVEYKGQPWWESLGGDDLPDDTDSDDSEFNSQRNESESEDGELPEKNVKGGQKQTRNEQKDERKQFQKQKGRKQFRANI